MSYINSSSSGGGSGTVSAGTTNTVSVYTAATTVGNSDITNTPGTGVVSMGAGVAMTIQTTAPTVAASTTAGTALAITASNATAGNTNAGAAAGGAVTITAGNAAQFTSGNANGGNINLVGGTGVGTGTGGIVVVPAKASTGVPTLAFAGFTTTGISGDTNGLEFYNAGTSYFAIQPGATAIRMGGSIALAFSSGDAVTTSADTFLSRKGAAVFQTSAAGGGSPTDISIVPSALTAGTMTQTSSAFIRKTITRFDWTNAMVVALGGVLNGNVSVCTLPAKTVVTNCYVVIKTAGTNTTTLTVAVGIVTAAYIDYIVASNAQAAANTVYGATSGDRGTNLTGYDLPSFTGTTVVNAHFISTGSNLSSVLTSTGSVYLETMTLP